MKKSNKYFRLGVILGMFLLVLAACSSDQSEPAEEPGESEESGGEVAFQEAIDTYQNSCISCHGTDLQGGAGPDLREVGANLSQDEIETVIRDGRGIMPGYASQFSQDQIVELAEWLASKN
ncbi:c-type cytochrome [Bacillus horti]|uniref:Cytochrome c551 n=1 Tax=Caldalkalibacillus horti TaxID=77523 RepID=A0ABT9VWI4_9BACI|nr:cytochrome c [Bacillus horti]MDQ0165329.1 cytochrome c551 [Bacillus horti]